MRVVLVGSPTLIILKELSCVCSSYHKISPTPPTPVASSQSPPPTLTRIVLNLISRLNPEILCAYARAHSCICTYNGHMHVRMHMHVHMHVCTCICTRAYARAYARHVHIYTWGKKKCFFFFFEIFTFVFCGQIQCFY